MADNISKNNYNGINFINAIYDTSENADPRDNLSKMGFKSFVTRKLCKILQELPKSLGMLEKINKKEIEFSLEKDCGESKESENETDFLNDICQSLFNDNNKNNINSDLNDMNNKINHFISNPVNPNDRKQVSKSLNIANKRAFGSSFVAIKHISQGKLYGDHGVLTPNGDIKNKHFNGDTIYCGVATLADADGDGAGNADNDAKTDPDKSQFSTTAYYDAQSFGPLVKAPSDVDTRDSIKVWRHKHLALVKGDDSVKIEKNYLKIIEKRSKKLKTQFFDRLKTIGQNTKQDSHKVNDFMEKMRASYQKIEALKAKVQKRKEEPKRWLEQKHYVKCL